jgi:hypothetical protein
MTAIELRLFFNRYFGLNQWPKTYKVDAETYGYCCQLVFDKMNQGYNKRTIKVGESGGLMFKGVELILENEK